MNSKKGVFQAVMIQMIKAIVDELKKMIVALIEFDYDEALEEMKKSNFMYSFKNPYFNKR